MLLQIKGETIAENTVEIAVFRIKVSLWKKS